MVGHQGLERQYLQTPGRDRLTFPLLPPLSPGVTAVSPWTSPILPKSNGWLLGCAVNFETNRQSTWVVFCTHVPDLYSVDHFAHSLFASLSFAVLGTLLTVLTREGTIRKFWNQISHLDIGTWIMAFLKYQDFVLHVWFKCSFRALLYRKSDWSCNVCNGISYDRSFITEKTFPTIIVKSLLG